MLLFDLVLILLFLGTVAAVAIAIAALFFRRWAFAGWLIVSAIVGWSVYLGAGTALALQSPQHVMAIGEDRCFDEMCFAVIGFRRSPAIEYPGGLIRPRGVFLIADVRISNRSAGHAQRENGRKGVLIDASGKVYETSLQGMAALSQTAGELPSLASEVNAGQSVATKLVFDIPADAGHVAFALGSDLSVNPARLVIGDEDHFLHKPTVVPLN